MTTTLITTMTATAMKPAIRTPPFNRILTRMVSTATTSGSGYIFGLPSSLDRKSLTGAAAFTVTSRKTPMSPCRMSTTTTAGAAHLPPPLLNCDLDPRSETFQDAMRRTQTQVEELNQYLMKVKAGGGPNAVERHLQRSKLLPRDRIRHLCDPGTPVLELSALAGNNISTPATKASNGDGDGDVGLPSGGIVTAIGSVSGQLCMIVCNDATVKGGTYHPITVKKHLRAQEIAIENDLPCIYLVDSGGM